MPLDVRCCANRLAPCSSAGQFLAPPAAQPSRVGGAGTLSERTLDYLWLAQRRPDSAFARGAFAAIILAAIALIPVLTTEHPPLYDLPNHLSRAYVLAHWDDVPEQHAFFERGSFLLPNVLSDLILIGLNWVLPATQAGRVLLVCIVLGTASGIWALNAAAFRRFTAWPAIGTLLLYHEYFMWGFLNYLTGIALLLWGLASWFWFRASKWPIRLAAAAVFALLIFFAHLVAFGLWALCIGVLEASRLVESHRWDARALAGAAARVVVPLIPPLGLFLWISPSSGLPAAMQFDFEFFYKVSILTRLLATGHGVFDLAVLVTLVALVIFFLARGLLAAERRLLIVAGFIMLAYVFLPFTALESGFLDARIPIVALMIAVAAFTLTENGTAATRHLVAIVLVLLTLRSTVLAMTWAEHDREYAEARAAMAMIPRGSIVFGITPEQPDGFTWLRPRPLDPPHEHTVSYATIDTHAVVPTIFAKARQNPLIIRRELFPLHRLIRQFIYRTPEDLVYFVAAARAIAVNEVARPRFIALFGANCETWPREAIAEPVWCGKRVAVMRL